MLAQSLYNVNYMLAQFLYNVNYIFDTEVYSNYFLFVAKDLHAGKAGCTFLVASARIVQGCNPGGMG